MALTKKTVKDINVNGKTVLLRTSLNVPIKNGKVTDELRLQAALPTINYLLQQNAKVVLISHHSDEGQSLAPVAPALAALLGKPVEFVPDCIGPEVERAVRAMQPGSVLMLENLRFHKGEEANDPEFAKQLAALAEMYVDDDFTTMHREHASMVGVPKLLPAVAGFQVEQEVNTITKAMEAPRRPLLVVVGGAKIATKIDFINNFLGKAQVMLIGGAMANTFLAAEGLEIGQSLAETSEIPMAQQIISDAKTQNTQLFLPLDVVVTSDIKQATNVRVVAVNQVNSNDIVADVGPRTIAQIQPVLNQKGTVIWNGPVGITETPAFAKGSTELARCIVDSGATSIVGGGDTAAFIDSLGWHDKFSFVSTGGGASLELMSGKTLPALAVLQDK